MDAELRRRDRNLEEAFKQRDEELEKWDAEWRTMIRDREVAFWIETRKHENVGG